MSERRIVLNTESARQTARQMLDRLPLGKPLCEVAFRRYKRRRTVKQNSRYRALLEAISEQLPDEDGKYHSPDVWHEFMRRRFLAPDTFVVDGEIQAVPKSTADLEVSEFGDFMTKVEVFASEHNVGF